MDQVVSGNNNFQEGVSTSDKPLESVEWTASEYITHEKSASWYVVYLTSALAITAFIFFVLNDLLASVTVFIVAISLGVVASRKPASKSYRLSSDGLNIDGKMYNLSEFKSFSLVEEGSIDSIWLKPLARFKPYLIIYFAPNDEEKIAELLNLFVPYEPRELDGLDKLAKRLRF